jgi:hypothetical protein
MRSPWQIVVLGVALYASSCKDSNNEVRLFTLWAFSELKLGLTCYATDNDHYPPESVGLGVLVSSTNVQWSGPYCRGNPLNDGWGMPIGYALTNGLVVLTSSGADKVKGTGDDMMDSWSSVSRDVARNYEQARSNRWTKMPNQAAQSTSRKRAETGR